MTIAFKHISTPFFANDTRRSRCYRHAVEDSAHFSEMLRERGIDPKWAGRATADPDRTEDHDDGTRHFLKRIAEFGDRWLRVVVNVTVTPNRRVTAFFDRSLRRSE